MSLETYDDARNGIARYQQPASPTVRTRTVARLTDWAESAQAAHEVATSLVQTSFVPEAFRGKAHEATAAILAGDEVGLSPMASLRAFDIIQGTAAPRAITHRAVVQAQGHAVWQVEATDTRAIFRGRRSGADEVQESVWTIERARQLGLTGKHNWKAQPKAMLIARATSEVCRLIASDALMGMPYSVEELTDGPPELQAPEAPAPTAPTRRTAQRRTQPRAAVPPPETPTEPVEDPEGPPLPGEDGFDEDPSPPAPPADAPATRPQLTKLHTIFSKGGITNRDTRLQACNLIIGRELTTSEELTKAEAHKLIEELEKEPQSTLAEFVAELIGISEEGTGEGL
jgi:hypothetical protein